MLTSTRRLVRAWLALLFMLSAVPAFAQSSAVVDNKTATWTSSTTVQALVTAVDGAAGTQNLNTVGAGCATIWMVPTGTITGGQLSFDTTINNGTTWVQLSGSNGDQTFVQSDLSPASTAYNGQEAGWRFPVNTFSKLRVRLQSAITGSGSITVTLRAVTGSCTPFAVVRQGDPTRLKDMPYGTVYAGTVPTANADAATASFPLDSYGVPYVRNDHPNRVICYKDDLGATLTELSNCAAQAGKSLYITDIIAISTTATAGAGSIREGTGTNCGTGTIGVLPVLSTSRTFTYPANTDARGPLTMSFNTPMKTLSANAVCAIGTAVNTLNLMILGFFDK